MKVLVPIRYQEFPVLWHSGITRTDLPAWSAQTNYPSGAKVFRGDVEYEALLSNQGIDPALFSEENPWFRLGAVNSLKAFDETIYDQAVGNPNENVIYQLTAPTTINTVALFNVQARSIRIQLLEGNSNTAIIQDIEVSLLDDEGIDDWADYFFETPNAQNEAIIDGLVAYPGTGIRIIVSSPSNVARIGQIVVGKSHRLGEMCEGTTIGIQDYSRKERDDWGNPVIVERPYSQRAEYDVAVPTSNVREVQRILATIRARPAVFFENETAQLGTTVYGYYQDFRAALVVGAISRMNLEVEGLV